MREGLISVFLRGAMVQKYQTVKSSRSEASILMRGLLATCRSHGRQNSALFILPSNKMRSQRGQSHGNNSGNF